MSTVRNITAVTEAIQNPVRAHPVPYLSIRASAGFAPLNLREIWRFRDLLLTLALRDIKLRYKQTALGIAWVILQPLIAAGIFTFVFSSVAKLPSDGVPYMLFAFAGLLGWNLFSGIVTRISVCLTGNSQLISKVFFPRLVLPLSVVPSFLLDFVIALAMLAVLILPRLSSVALGLPLLTFPLWIGLLILLAVGSGLYFAALNVSYRDVQYVIPVAMQMLLYASPIPYAVSAVPERLRIYYYINPLASIIEGLRWSLLGKTSVPNWWAVAYSVAVCIIVFFAGAFIFKRMERKFADVI